VAAAAPTTGTSRRSATPAWDSEHHSVDGASRTRTGDLLGCDSGDQIARMAPGAVPAPGFSETETWLPVTVCMTFSEPRPGAGHPDYPQLGRLTGKFWPKVVPQTATVTWGRAAFAGTSLMELAGLEPATSWVRSKCGRFAGSLRRNRASQRAEIHSQFAGFHRSSGTWRHPRGKTSDGHSRPKGPAG
jgi:hypothetical protein